MIVRVGEEEMGVTGRLSVLSPVLPSPWWAIGLACIVFLLHNANHLLYLLL